MSSSCGAPPNELPVRNVGSRPATGQLGVVSGARSAALLNRRKIPDDIVNNEALNRAIAILPSNYNFEIHKTLWRIRTDSPKTVALQFPEGLLMYSCTIADILKSFGGVHVLILGDVTYGACCVDDFTAHKLGADLLVHYGHSCLVPVSVTKMKIMYVFVEIFFESSHFIECVKNAFPRETRIALMGTIQFVSIIHQAASELSKHFSQCVIPQAKPLSAGETLGCTSPVISGAEVLVFVADGRFHLEAAMIQNPSLSAFRYDPYSKYLTAEGYDIEKMKSTRLDAITRAKGAYTFGLVLGTLGRQGNPPIFDRLRKILNSRGKRVIPFLMSELNPSKLELISAVEVWVQVACPRLSIDWSGGFDKPILTPYELEVAMEETQFLEVYPMSYYRADGGLYTNGGHSR